MRGRKCRGCVGVGFVLVVGVRKLCKRVQRELEEARHKLLVLGFGDLIQG